RDCKEGSGCGKSLRPNRFAVEECRGDAEVGLDYHRPFLAKLHARCQPPLMIVSLLGVEGPTSAERTATRLRPGKQRWHFALDVGRVKQDHHRLRPEERQLDESRTPRSGVVVAADD